LGDHVNFAETTLGIEIFKKQGPIVTESFLKEIEAIADVYDETLKELDD